MGFRKAVPADAQAIIWIYDRAKLLLRKRGVNQWQNGYPNPLVVDTDIASGIGYVMEEEGAVTAAVVLIDTPEPTYAQIEGAWLTNGCYGTIHRIAVSRPFQHAGVATQVMEAAEAELRSRGLPSVRIDTHKDNAAMHALLASRGFTACGIIHLADGSPRIAYEKLL